MLLTSADKPFDYRQPPRLSLGIAFLLIVLGYWLLPINQAQWDEMTSFYQQHLLEVEWPLYPPHLEQQHQGDKVSPLTEAYHHQDYLTLTTQMGADRHFVESISTNYLEPDVFSQWQHDRQQFEELRNHLSDQIFGLDPQRFRPITFVSYSFLPDQVRCIIVTALLLLLIGMITEWTMGSGALLAAGIAGSMTGGGVWLLGHLHDVIPLTGSGNALAGILGLALIQFRHSHSIRVWDTPYTFSGWVLLVPLIVANAGLQAAWHNFDLWRFWAACMASVSGMVTWLLWQRWFAPLLAQEDTPVVVMDAPKDEEYRQGLNAILQKVAEMQFANAEKGTRHLLESYPKDTRLLEQLYHLIKNKTHELEFEEVAFMLFTMPSQPSNNSAALRIYRDYSKRSKTFVALDESTSLQLVLRFARISALKEAEELFRRVVDSKRDAPLLAKAAQTLAEIFTRLQQEQRASYYRKFARP